MAIDRVADDGKGAHQILAVESARLDHSAQTRCHRQTALAHRARLRRIEAGTWPGTFRRPELARLSSPCNSIDCCLRLPGSGAVPFFPLRRLAADQSSPHSPSHTPRATRLHAQRRCPSAQNGIILNPLPLYADRSQPTLLALCPDVLVVCIHVNNTVVLRDVHFERDGYLLDAPFHYRLWLGLRFHGLLLRLRQRFRFL